MEKGIQLTEAIRGDNRAINSVLSLCARAFGDEDHDEGSSAEDQDIVDAFTLPSAKSTEI